MMSRSDIRTEVLDLVDEETYGYWTSGKLNRRINRAYKELVREIHLLNRKHYRKSGTITTTASTWTVDLPSDCVQVIRIYDSDGNQVYYSHDRQFDETEEGQPSYFNYYDHDSLCFDVTPDSAYSYTILYVYVPSDMSSDTDEPDVPIGGDEIIAMMVAYDIMASRGDDNSIEMYRRLDSARSKFLSRVGRGYVGGPEKILRGDGNYGMGDWREY